MKIEAFIIAWNESETIHLTIKHYQKFCAKITIYDNYSTDSTPEIAKAMGCEVKQFGIKGILSDVEYTRLKDHCWQDSKSDWVIVVDADEILQEPSEWSGTVLRTFGWQVFSEKVPHANWEEENRGFYDANYSKLCCFKPQEIQQINYIHGCHVAKPKGNIVYSNTVTPLFHYRNVGGWSRLIARHAQYRERLSEWNKRWNAGIHYTYDDERRIREWKEQYEKSVPFSPDFILQSQTETRN